MLKFMPLPLAAAICALAPPATAQTAPEMTLEQVSPDDPFGDIDVTLTMLDPRTISAWAGGLDEERRAELDGRCAFMLANAMRYDIAPRAFCQTLAAE